MKRLLIAVCALAVATVAFAGQEKKAGGKPYAQFQTSEGNFTIELFEKDAPKTVANFIGLAEGKKEWTDPRTGEKTTKPYYNGLTFHRVIADFMIQGGDPTGTGTGGPGYTFPDEFHSELRFDRPYLLAMANAGPGTNGSQFFITVVPTGWLNMKHTIFGQVADADSQKVVDSIATTDTDRNDRPLQEVVIERVEIERAQ